MNMGSGKGRQKRLKVTASKDIPKTIGHKLCDQVGLNANISTRNWTEYCEDNNLEELYIIPYYLGSDYLEEEESNNPKKLSMPDAAYVLTETLQDALFNNGIMFFNREKNGIDYVRIEDFMDYKVDIAITGDEKTLVHNINLVHIPTDKIIGTYKQEHNPAYFNASGVQDIIRHGLRMKFSYVARANDHPIEIVNQLVQNATIADNK